MQKDVIYIDVDDDVTAIIGKIKKSKEKIVAIVPPKRAGALQSAINLRLLDRMAKTSKKKLVLVTNNQALVALAANASIPVAKNLQSKPEIAEIPAVIVDEGDDIIDGSELPVGDHAKSLKVSDNTKVDRTEGRSDAIESLDIDGEETAVSAAGIGVAGAVSKKVASARNKAKIPNFDKFRKRLFLGIGGGVLLVALLIWMFAFAPAATVIITAKTSPAPVSSTVKLGGTAATDFKMGVIKSVSQQEKKDVSIEFDATGQKDIGDKAVGTVRFSTSDASTAINGATIPAGTRLTTNTGLTFTTDNAVAINSSNYTGTNVGVTAVESGTKYNGASGALSGAPSTIAANFVGSATGGTSKVAKVVSADDIERAKGTLIGQSTEAEKNALIKKFTNGEKVIDSSFTVDRAESVSVPAGDQEAPASGKAKLTIATTFTIHAVPKADLETYLNASIKAQLDDANAQKVYNSGIDKATLSNFRKEGETLTASITASGQIGPQIDEAVIKDKVKGKIYGEAQSILEAINGIQEVDVHFSFFWVRSIPSDTNKIDIEFKLKDEN
jgi:hypothetical protein